MKIKKTNNPDYGYTNKEELYLETQQHRNDVFRLMSCLALEIMETGYEHDWTKIRYFDNFAQDTLEREDGKDFKEREWYKIHTSEERHHLNTSVPNDVDLIDVLEFISDCVVAGKARSGKVDKRYLQIESDVLMAAFWNTIDKMIDEVDVVD